MTEVQNSRPSCGKFPIFQLHPAPGTESFARSALRAEPETSAPIWFRNRPGPMPLQAIGLDPHQ